MSNTYCVVFVFVFCALCCQFIWIVHFWLSLRYHLTFIYKKQRKPSTYMYHKSLTNLEIRIKPSTYHRSLTNLENQRTPPSYRKFLTTVENQRLPSRKEWRYQQKGTKGQTIIYKTQKFKDRATRTPLKTVGDLRCSWRVNLSCSTSHSRRITIATNLVISHEWGKDRTVITTNGTYPWSFVIHCCNNDFNLTTKNPWLSRFLVDSNPL